MADPVPQSLARLADLAREFAEAYENPKFPLDEVLERGRILRDELVAAALPAAAERATPRACTVDTVFGGPAMVGNWS